MTEMTSNPDGFIEHMASLVGLSIAAEHRPGVGANFERIIEVAQLVNEFPLPEEIEVAPIFEP